MELFNPIPDSEAENLQGGFFWFKPLKPREVAIEISRPSCKNYGGLAEVNIVIGWPKGDDGCGCQEHGSEYEQSVPS